MKLAANTFGKYQSPKRVCQTHRTSHPFRPLAFLSAAS